MKTLEDILQKNFGLKGNLCLSRPRKNSDNVSHYTIKGYNAYERLMECINAIELLTGIDMGNIVDALDAIENDTV